MSLHIIIDGYNLIRQSNRFSSSENLNLQQEREALVEALAAYKKVKHHRISVIFDGAGAPSFVQNRDRIKGIYIRFSRKGQTADTIIKKMAFRERERAVVVSSDREIAVFAESHGAATIDSARFEAKLIAADHADAGQTTPAEIDKRPLSTRKKGPGKKRSKRERRNRIKTCKL